MMLQLCNCAIAAKKYVEQFVVPGDFVSLPFSQQPFVLFDLSQRHFASLPFVLYYLFQCHQQLD
jgi:hypothetical protein